MILDIEHARTRLQEIFAILEQADSDDERFDYQTLDEMRSLEKYLHENSLNIRSVRHGHKLIVELEPMAVETLVA